MDHSEFFGLTTYLTTLYEERFPPLTPAMAQIWYEALAPMDEDLASSSVKRWARQHTTLAPSLDQVLEQVEILREEQARASRPRSTPKSVADILREQLADATIFPQLHDSDNTIFRKLMILLMERSCEPWKDTQDEWHNKLDLEGRITQCYAWAKAYQASNPPLAEALEYQGRAYTRTQMHEEAAHAST